MQITDSRRDPADHPFEIVERKGSGHPDTLSDLLAEELSRSYSVYTLGRFGAILRHQFDKTALMCGRCKVTFGGGQMIEPIRILVNGRASARLGGEKIPVRDILMSTVKTYFADRFPMLDTERDLRVLYEVREGLHTTTGGIWGDAKANAAAIHYRFNPRSLSDLPETRCVRSNDTSLGCSFAPFTKLERLVLEIEADLISTSAAEPVPWLGSDIKIMAVRRGRNISLVVAAPILASVTPAPADYFARVAIIEGRVRVLTDAIMTDHHLERVTINSSDDLDGRKLYMNFTGSSIESGDEGMVGRGNRMGGLIAPLRPYTMEGICGKNPLYHVGKVYSVAAFEIADRLAKEHGVPSNVYLVNRMADPLNLPWYAHVEVSGRDTDEAAVSSVVDDVVGGLSRITKGILDRKYRLA